MEKREYGFSYPWGKPEITEILLPKLPSGATILDVGAGEGVYKDFLGDNFQWEAVEIWPETANYLKDKYNVVYETDICDFSYPKKYDLIIFGDVIEHLSIPKAKKVLTTAKLFSKIILIAIPYQLKQNMLYGNPSEYHVQSDITLDNFKERYPGFELAHLVTQKKKPVYGYYLYEGEK